MNDRRIHGEKHIKTKNRTELVRVYSVSKKEKRETINWYLDGYD